MGRSVFGLRRKGMELVHVGHGPSPGCIYLAERGSHFHGFVDGDSDWSKCRISPKVRKLISFIEETSG